MWTIVSPWASGYAINKAAVADELMVGVLVTALAIWSLPATATEVTHPPSLSGH